MFLALAIQSPLFKANDCYRLEMTEETFTLDPVEPTLVPWKELIQTVSSQSSDAVAFMDTKGTCFWFRTELGRVCIISTMNDNDRRIEIRAKGTAVHDNEITNIVLTFSPKDDQLFLVDRVRPLISC